MTRKMQVRSEDAALPSSMPATGEPLSRAETAALIAAVVDRESASILITGEPGMGKSTLVDRGAEQFAAAGVTVLRASPSFAERYTAYSTLWDLLGELEWESLVDLPDEHRVIVEIALGHQRSTAELPSLATAVALEAILTELASRAPVVLLIDDLQWADPESTATVERAFRRLAGRGVGLVATSRELRTGGDFAFDPGDVVALSGLSVDELEALTAPAWPSTVTRAQIVALREHTGGNPMWALELIARGQIGDLGALPVGTLVPPPALAVVVADGLAALGPAAAEVVSAVALLGRPSLSLLSDVLRYTGIADDAVHEAEAAGFLVLTTQTVRTRHPLQASAAAARLSPARRRELHAFIARAVDDPVVRAQHLQQSQPPGPHEGIAEALALAAVAMRQRGARLRSAHFDAQAVERTDPSTAHYDDRLLNQAQQLFSAGDLAACLRALDRVSPSRLGTHQYDAYLALSTSSLASAHGAPATRAFLAGRAAADAADATRLAMIEAGVASTDDTVTVQWRARAAARVLAALTAGDTPNAVHRALRAAARSRVDAGDGLDAAIVAEMDRLQSIEIVVGLDDTGLATAGLLAHLADDVDTSRAAFAGLVQWARSEGKEGIETVFLALGAFVEIVAGDVAAASELARLSGFCLDSPTLPAAVRPMAGLLLVAAGRHDELAHAVDGWRVTADDDSVELAGLVGLSAIARRDWPVAVENLRRAALLADARGLVEPGSRFRVDLPLAEALLQSGELDEAGRRLAIVRGFLAGHDRPISQIALHRVTSLELAAGGDLDAALEHATAAAELAAAHQRPADEARALLQQARVLVRLRRVTLSRAALEAALERAEASGDADALDQVESALATTRRKKSPTELTAAESGVLALVRVGQTNKQIAAELFISVRTVESHVAAALRKTGAANRSTLITRG